MSNDAVLSCFLNEKFKAVQSTTYGQLALKCPPELDIPAAIIELRHFTAMLIKADLEESKRQSSAAELLEKQNKIKQKMELEKQEVKGARIAASDIENLPTFDVNPTDGFEQEEESKGQSSAAESLEKQNKIKQGMELEEQEVKRARIAGSGIENLSLFDMDEFELLWE